MNQFFPLNIPSVLTIMYIQCNYYINYCASRQCNCSQVLWLTGEMVKTGVAGADKLCFALLKQLPAGSTFPGDVYIAENLMHILLDNRFV